MLASRWLLCSFAIITVVGLACEPTTRTYENTGGNGGGGTCAPGAIEDCFNGADDDCNGETDCEDPACGEVAVCEPLALAAPSGVLVSEAEACPDGYTADEQVIHRKLDDGGGCAGCDCTVPTPTCTGDVWYYESAAACAAGTNVSGGTFAGTYGEECSPKPINSGSSSFVFGVRTSAWKIEETCSAGGTATPAPATWGTSMKFCRANAEGKGCGAGNTCVKKTGATARHCALAAGSSSCTGFAMAQSDWYTGFTDSRTCGACGCKASGGSCDPVQLAVGSDYACYPTPAVNQASKQCFTANPSGIYSPPVQLVNKGTVGTCKANAPFTGSLDATGQSTLCCQP